MYVYRPACVNTWTKSGVERKSNEPEGCTHIQKKREKHEQKYTFSLPKFSVSQKNLRRRWDDLSIEPKVIYERRWEIRPLLRYIGKEMMKGETFLKAWPFCIHFFFFFFAWGKMYKQQQA